MRIINSYKRKLQAIFDYIENEQIEETNIYENIIKIKNKNYFNLEELKLVLGTGATNITLDENDINYTIIPKNDISHYQLLIGIEEGLVSIPCYSLDQDGEWDLDVFNMQHLEYEDVRKIQSDLDKIVNNLNDLIGQYEVLLVTQELGGEVIT